MRNKILSLLVLLLTAASGAWAEETYTITFAANGNTVTKENVTLPKTYQCSFEYANGELDLILKELYGWTGDEMATFCDNSTTPTSSDANKVVAGQNGNDDYITINNVFEGTVTITSRYFVNGSLTPYSLEISFAVDPNDVEVTTNAASEGSTFTEATFAMPAFDATAEYELVRDMSISMPVTVGDGNEGYRIRLKKNQSGKFEPADMSPQAMAGLIAVTDAIEQKTLTNATDYTVSIFAVDDQDLPTGQAITFQDLVPGRYVAIATAKDGSIYEGQTEKSNVFVLFQGYEIEVAAGEYATYYKDENLYVEDNEAKLYTITSVGQETATAAQLSVAAAYTPILVKNESAEKKTILLIPTLEEADDVEYAPEFIGTLEAATIAASTDAQSNYAFNGKAFVWVKNAIEVGANKAWLSISNSNARAISLVFDDDATGVRSIDNGQLTIDNWYDLNGRKVANSQLKKGVYIVNGRKVVVK